MDNTNFTQLELFPVSGILHRKRIKMNTVLRIRSSWTKSFVRVTRAEMSSIHFKSMWHCSIHLDRHVKTLDYYSATYLAVGFSMPQLVPSTTLTSSSPTGLYFPSTKSCMYV